jgi:hypothetical protein
VYIGSAHSNFMVIGMTSSDYIEFTGISTMAGTAREVARRLNQADDQQVVAFMLPQAGVQQREAIAQTLETLVQLTVGCQISREREALESLINVILPGAPMPEMALREAATIRKARAEVLESAEWLSAAQWAEVAGLSTVNPNAGPSRWKREHRIFSIKPKNSGELFPAYGLDPARNYRPRPEMQEIITLLKDRKDGWGLAYWFSALNGFLGGRRPQDVLSTAPSEVVAAAADEAKGIVHG